MLKRSMNQAPRIKVKKGLNLNTKITVFAMKNIWSSRENWQNFHDICFDPYKLTELISVFPCE